MNARSLSILYRLLRDQWRPRQELEALQLDRLRAVLRHAWAHVPYYRQRLDEAGLRPDDVRSVDDLARLPVTTRAQLQALPPEAITDRRADLSRCKRVTTAGSSGMPLPVYSSRAESDRTDLVWARASLACGRRLLDRTAYFKFSMPPRLWFERLGLWRRLLLSITDAPETCIAHLRRLKPDVIRANPLMLRELADAMQRAGIRDIRPRLIFTMGSLLDDEARALIESAFGCSVYDAYGSTELGCIAWECPHRAGYHVNVDTLLLQIETEGRPARPGEPGRIVLTHLQAFTMPFIRYDIGDIAAWSEAPCPCGRGLPLLKRLDGRADDFLADAGGKRYSPGLIVNRLRSTPGVRQFRLVQEQPERVRLLIVPAPDADKAGAARAAQEALRSVVGEAIRIDAQLCEALPPDPGHKIRSIVSTVPKAF